MIDQPAQPGLMLPETAIAPITFRNLWFPWTELEATGVPPDRMTTDLHVQLSLAMLAGQAAGRPRLVQVDENGNLGSSSPPVDQGEQVFNIGDFKANVLARVAGEHALVVMLDGIPSQWSVVTVVGMQTGKTYYNQNPVSDNNTLYVFPLPFPWDDAFQVSISASGVAVNGQKAHFAAVLDTAAVIATNPRGPANSVTIGDRQLPPVPYCGFNAFSTPGAGVAATATLPAVAGRRYACHRIVASLLQNGAAAHIPQLLLRDGASGIGAILWATNMGLDAVVGHTDRIALTSLGRAGTLGNAMTLEYNAGPPANAFQAVEFGAYALDV